MIVSRRMLVKSEEIGTLSASDSERIALSESRDSASRREKIPLIGAEDVITRGKKKEEVGEKKKEKIKKPKEKPIRILRIKFYEKISLSFIEADGKKGQNDIFAVNRGLEKLLKELYFDVGNHGMEPPSDCIFVAKDHRMVNNYKFIYIDINKDEMSVLKKNLEDPTTIYAFNKGEFSILEGKMSSLKETWDIPKIYR